MEATRDDDAEKNRLCPPTPFPNTLAEWAHMNVMGARAARSFGSEPDIKAWADAVALNPARIPPDRSGSGTLDGVLARLQTHIDPGLARLAELSGRAPAPAR